MIEILPKEKRSALIDRIVKSVSKKGETFQDVGNLCMKRVNLPNVGVEIKYSKSNEYPPIVEIIEFFGVIPTFNEKITLQNLNGFRRRFIGTYDGLSEIQYNGIMLPNEKGDIRSSHLQTLYTKKNQPVEVMRHNIIYDSYLLHIHKELYG